MNRVKKTAYVGILSALAVTLGYLETMLPMPVNIPGVKVGLSNIAVITALYVLGGGFALLVGVVKAVVCGTLFWGFQGAVYALFGIVFSVGAMLLMKKMEFSVVSVSSAGALSHNGGQLIAFYIFSGSFSYVYYISVLGLSALFMGTVTGILSDVVIKKIKNLK